MRCVILQLEIPHVMNSQQKYEDPWFFLFDIKQDLNFKMRLRESPGLALLQRILDELLAASTGYGDFIVYHRHINHNNANLEYIYGLETTSHFFSQSKLQVRLLEKIYRTGRDYSFLQRPHVPHTSSAEHEGGYLYNARTGWAWWPRSCFEKCETNLNSCFFLLYFILLSSNFMFSILFLSFYLNRSLERRQNMPEVRIPTTSAGPAAKVDDIAQARALIRV